jgi:hypothetical protein
MTLDTFVNLSVILTGYPKSKIQPQNNTQKLPELYFGVLNKEVPSDLIASLNDTFLAIPDPDESSVKAKIVMNDKLGPVAKNILKMWYLGIWYDLDKKKPDNSYVVSNIAYKNGLAWSTMYAHPMGYSEENFEYWNTPPQT